MKFRTILGLLIVIIVCSCSQRTTKGVLQIEDGSKQHLELKTGLKIDYGPNHGAIDEYTAGNYMYITATITNDTIIPIHLQVAISDEFDYPDSCSDYKYKVRTDTRYSNII